MADFNFENLLVQPLSYPTVDEFGFPVLDGPPLRDLSFDLAYLPSTQLDLPLDCTILWGMKYYDEEQNVWYYRWDGVVHMGPVEKIMSKKDYPMSILLPLDWIGNDK